MRELCATVSLATVALAFACASPSPQRGATAYGAAALPSTQVFFYPLRGQRPEQQDRDRYECYRWAVRQSGFDPSLPRLAPHQRVHVVATEPPGSGVIEGAVTGAAIGALAAGHDHAADGAAIGAAVGALAGAVDGALREQGRRELEDDLRMRRHAQLEVRADGYRRALSACLEGRGYQVR